MKFAVRETSVSCPEISRLSMTVQYIVASFLPCVVRRRNMTTYIAF